MAAFGERLRALMAERGISQRELARRVPCNSGYLSRLASGKRVASESLVRKLDDLLDADGDLVALARTADHTGVRLGSVTARGVSVETSAPPHAGDDDDVKRRAALQLLAALGVSTATLGAEPLRHLADLALTAEPRDLDDWHLACVDHLHALRTRAATQARKDLVIDLLALDRQLDAAPAGDVTELQRVKGALAMLHAHLLSRLGDHGAAIRWWRTARAASDSSGDLDLRLMVRCEEAGVGLYGQRDVGTVLTLTHSAERIAGDGASFWKADLAGTRAKAFTLLGQHDQAVQALNSYVGYGEPDAPTSILPTLWTDDQAHFAQSWVHAGAGDEAAADRARDLVLARSGDRQYAANVRLHEALCTVVQGGIDRGVRQAAIILDTIPAAFRTQMITEVGRTVLNAVPYEQRHRPAVREFRHVLTTTAPKPALPPAT
ncbi:helix-turn-helix protein [Actinomadura pelletieri DSM 43383]|uniref:Helix-turn-helix protein n=1 Tax=Actinomadura pelletieri DSM 43383 TaxID=1120940 RepID=A0A495QFM5_9ACTN|nr:helix-turn-helix transcriptional regulator [Actinomadura pelletieri]RKS70727.1 helix-turn-helix protein [Actinomadura pelletieri DSM 43383]